MDINKIQEKIISAQNPDRKYEEDVALLELENQSHSLIVHNDEVNTFDFVIDTLMEICQHSPEQAEQCTWLIHYKGKCDVKSGSMDELMPRHQKLLSRGLTSEIV